MLLLRYESRIYPLLSTRARTRFQREEVRVKVDDSVETLVRDTSINDGWFDYNEKQRTIHDGRIHDGRIVDVTFGTSIVDVTRRRGDEDTPTRASKTWLFSTAQSKRKPASIVDSIDQYDRNRWSMVIGLWMVCLVHRSLLVWWAEAKRESEKRRCGHQHYWINQGDSNQIWYKAKTDDGMFNSSIIERREREREFDDSCESSRDRDRGHGGAGCTEDSFVHDRMDLSKNDALFNYRKAIYERNWRLL